MSSVAANELVKSGADRLRKNLPPSEPLKNYQKTMTSATSLKTWFDANMRAVFGTAWAKDASDERIMAYLTALAKEGVSTKPKIMIGIARCRDEWTRISDFPPQPGKFVELCSKERAKKWNNAKGDRPKGTTSTVTDFCDVCSKAKGKRTAELHFIVKRGNDEFLACEVCGTERAKPGSNVSSHETAQSWLSQWRTALRKVG